jgi:phage terminase small subunit
VRVSLSLQRQLFVSEYLTCWNATEAARRAGYSERSAYSQGQRLLKNDEVLAAIRVYLDAKQMTADEALTLLADMARGDIGEFMDVSSMSFQLKLLDENGERKNTRVIKKIKQKTTTFIAKKESDEDREVHEIEFELYDAQAAIDKILRVAGKYNDKVDVTSAGKALRIIVNWDDSAANPD